MVDIITGAISTVVNPDGSRLTAGYSESRSPPQLPNPQNATIAENNTPSNVNWKPEENLSDTAGRRARLRPKPGGADKIYGNGLLARLKKTNGMVWPYQPQITWNQSVSYTEMELIHSNQDIQAYKRTPSSKFQVEGDWSVQNQDEGLYALSCIHYLRTVSKMNFGDKDPNRGTPPPVLLFDAFGAYMFNSLPVIVTEFSIGLPKDVDYLPVDVSETMLAGFQGGNWTYLTRQSVPSSLNSSIAWLPVLFTITVGLMVQNTPQRLRAFDLDSFRNGQLLKQGGWI